MGKDRFEIKCFPNATGTAKAAFVKYIGKENDLSGYQRSYKLVFLKSLFENWNDSGEIPAYTVSLAFQKLYIARKQQGLIPDVTCESWFTYIGCEPAFLCSNETYSHLYNLIR